MTLKSDLPNLSDRLASFAARFDEQLKKKRAAKEGSPLETFISNLHDLFTEDVTGEGLRDLIRRDTRDTLRFFTREIDFETLRLLPWWKRYPALAWQIFLALAHRLNPPRRIAFAVATFSFLIGFLHLFSFSSPSDAIQQRITIFAGGTLWFFIGGGLFMLLLLMELRDKLDLKGDLEIAREIQSGLVPSQPFQKGSIAIDCFMRPANTVGGDYHDIIELSANRVAVVIGDVSGKGMPAALLMALVQGSLRTLIAAGLRGPELIAKLNDYLVASFPANRLVTLFYSELDTLTGDLQYVNAGHNPPFLARSGGTLERLDPTAMVLGVEVSMSPEAGTAVLQAGDHLLLYTDGISEAFNEREEEYGEQRMVEFLRKNAALNHEALIEGMIRDVLQFCGTSRLTDDMTLVWISRRPEV
jgi:sigma-B regulation protein RsbU (phosphoserine phosphatase)